MGQSSGSTCRGVNHWDRHRRVELHQRIQFVNRAVGGLPGPWNSSAATARRASERCVGSDTALSTAATTRLASRSWTRPGHEVHVFRRDVSAGDELRHRDSDERTVEQQISNPIELWSVTSTSAATSQGEASADVMRVAVSSRQDRLQPRTQSTPPEFSNSAGSSELSCSLTSTL